MKENARIATGETGTSEPASRAAASGDHGAPEDLPDRVPGPHDLPHVRSRVARGRDARDPGPPVRPGPKLTSTLRRRSSKLLRSVRRWRTEEIPALTR